jgi:hypothetical protein
VEHAGTPAHGRLPTVTASRYVEDGSERTARAPGLGYERSNRRQGRVLSGSAAGRQERARRQSKVRQLLKTHVLDTADEQRPQFVQGEGLRAAVPRSGYAEVEQVGRFTEAVVPEPLPQPVDDRFFR